MEKREEKLRIELMEAILDYFEGQKSFGSVLGFGMSADTRGIVLKNPHVAEVIAQLHVMGTMVAVGQSVSREDIKETFTQMLEKLMQGY